MEAWNGTLKRRRHSTAFYRDVLQRSSLKPCTTNSILIKFFGCEVQTYSHRYFAKSSAGSNAKSGRLKDGILSSGALEERRIFLASDREDHLTSIRAPLSWKRLGKTARLIQRGLTCPGLKRSLFPGRGG